MPLFDTRTYNTKPFKFSLSLNKQSKDYPSASRTTALGSIFSYPRVSWQSTLIRAYRHHQNHRCNSLCSERPFTFPRNKQKGIQQNMRPAFLPPFLFVLSLSKTNHVKLNTWKAVKRYRCYCLLTWICKYQLCTSIYLSISFVHIYQFILVCSYLSIYLS